MQADWAKVDSLMGGTRAMRAAGETYLPRWPQEDTASYDFRLKTTTLYNAFKRTVENMAGKPFSEPVSWTGIDAEVEAWFDDIDLAGRNLHVFAAEVFKAGLRYGLTHMLVDFPVTKNPDGSTQIRTRADELKAGVRPNAVHVKPTSILGWKSKKVRGIETLVQVRIMECVTDDDGEFGLREVQQVRVLTPGAFALYRKNAKDEWIIHEEGVTTLDFIPLCTFYTRRTGFMMAEPPLDDLADLNIKHWQSQSDQDSIMHTARVPILAISGVSDEDKVVVGAKAALMLPTGASAEWVEHSGAAIEAGRNSLKDLEEQMRAMGAELLVQQPGDKTATQSSIDTAQAQCQLSAMAQALEDSLDAMVDVMSAWAGKGDQGDIDVFDDFSSDSMLLTAGPFILALIQLVNSGLMSKGAAFEEMRRYGIVNPDLAWKDVQDQIALEPPSFAVPMLKPDPAAA
jgi:hypothetical protein